MKIYIKSGVTNDLAFDYTYNAPTDIIDFVTPQIYESKIGDKIFWFGYEFKPDVDTKTRTEFIHSVKQIGDNPLTDSQLRQFIERPLGYLDKKINLSTLDAFVYPVSGRSPLVKKIIECVNAMSGHDVSRSSFELIKSLPEDVTFDWEQFETDKADNPQSFNDAKKYIEEQLLPRIHNLDYFSIASSVPSKYRKYVQNYLSFDTTRQQDKFKQLADAKNILIVDDIATSGATLREILRITKAANSIADIYVYTLIGKE